MIPSLRVRPVVQCGVPSASSSCVFSSNPIACLRSTSAAPSAGARNAQNNKCSRKFSILNSSFSPPPVRRALSPLSNSRRDIFSIPLHFQSIARALEPPPKMEISKPTKKIEKSASSAAYSTLRVSGLNPSPPILPRPENEISSPTQLPNTLIQSYPEIDAKPISEYEFERFMEETGLPLDVSTIGKALCPEGTGK